MQKIIRGLLRSIFIILFMSGCTAIRAQSDTAKYTQRHFDQSSLKQYEGKKDFTYENAPPAGVNIFSWLWYQFQKLLGNVFGSDSELSVIKVVMYILMIVAIVFIVLNLAGINVGRFLIKEAQIIVIPEVGEENIREMNMDEMIAEAVAKKQWRLSVRYLYLKALRLLTDRELIRWQSGKTNMDYYYELREDDLKHNFLTATSDFENAWYGNAEVTEEHFKESKGNLEKFYELIKNN